MIRKFAFVLCLVAGTACTAPHSLFSEDAGKTGGAMASADKTEWLQSLLDSGNGVVSFPDGEFIVSRPLEITDNTRLVCSPKTYLRLADGANCPIIKNRDKGREMTRGITIEGGVWDGNNLTQQRDQPKDKMHKWGQFICFTYTENLTLRDMTVKDPESFAIQLTATEQFTVENIVFDFNMKRNNMDGIHINGFARNGDIRNIKGGTNDDMIALNSDEGFFACGNCDIENITIDGIYGGKNAWTAVRLLSRVAKLKNIVIRNIYGSYKYNAVSFTHWSKTPGDFGWFDNIVIENVFASSARKSGKGHGGLIWFQKGVKHVGSVIIRNVMRIDEPDALNDVHTVEVYPDVSIESLTLQGISQRVPDNKQPIEIDAGAKIGKLTVNP